MADSTYETSVERHDPPFGDEERCRALMSEFCTRVAPSRFGLWQVLPGWTDARMVGWGYADADEAILDLPGQLHRTSRAALEHTLELLGLCAIWIDPEPTINP
jgi:hypothetical protein